MMESRSVPETSFKLSPIDRLLLIQSLNALPSAQFDELIFALQPPKGNIPGNTAPQSSRSTALLEWAESSIGPGLQALEELLNKFVAKKSKTAEQFLSFAISGQLGDVTPAEIRAIVRLLRKKTGDETIDVAFSKEGSINIILSGSSKGLEKLKELCITGELENLEIPYVEAIHDVVNATDIQKARLVQILRLESIDKITLIQNLSRVHESALNLVSSLNLISTRNLDSSGVNDLNKVINLAQGLAQDLERARGLVYTQRRISAITHARIRAHKLDLAIARIRRIYHIEIVLDLARARNHARALADTLTRKIELSGADLSNTSLRDINLRHANLTEVDFSRSDLTGADLSEANLTGANFNEANVQETVFGENLGLTRLDKSILRQRGAIILDPPSSQIPNLVMR